MSAERGGRRGASNRSIQLLSSKWSALILLLALLIDLGGAAGLITDVAKKATAPLSWASLTDFSNQAVDLGVLALVRLCMALLLCFPVRYLFHDSDEEEDDEVNEADPNSVVVEGGSGSGEAGALVAERSGSRGHRSGPSSAQNSGEYAVVETEEEDMFSNVRRRAQIRQRNQRIKAVVQFSAFLVFTMCNIYVAVKCLFFQFTHSPHQELLMGLTVLWVNVEVFALDLVLDDAVAGTDAFRPQIHPHPLRFNLNVAGTKCDVCNQHIIKEDFECTECDFDCCLPCYKRKAMAAAAAGDYLAPTTDGGATPVDTRVSPLRYVWRSLLFLVPYWRELLLALSCLVATQIIRVSLPNFQGKVLDSIISFDTTSFWSYLKWYCALSTCTLLLGSVRSFCSMLVMRNLTMGVREQLFSKLIYRDISFFDATTVGSLTARMTNDVQAMVSPVNTLMNSVLSNLITLVGGIFMCLTVSWRLAMISLTVVGPIVLITSKYASWSARISRGVWDSLAQANSTATEAFSNIRTVRSFSTEEYEKKKFSESMTEALNQTLRDALAFSGVYLATNLMDLGASAVLLGFGGYLVMTKPEELTAGKLVTFQLYANMLNSAYQGLNNVVTQFTKSAGAAERVLTMLDGEPVIKPHEGQELTALSGTIELQNVRFYYLMRPDRIVLNDISVSFPQNTVTAIVGRSGGGKSTLMHLLLRMYDPQVGRVLVDGHDLRDLHLTWLHHQFAVVAQDTQLFNTTIEANIGYGLKRCSTYDVYRAARDANAHDFIMSFPEGYKTQVGERGVRLSGGQRQRIAIARALLRRPRVLLLDEATSALDAESEALVQQALDKLIADLQESCTIIIIAHRLSTIVNANNIVVLDGGAVAEQGTHTQLLQRQGAYWRLVSRQLRDGRATINFDDDDDETAGGGGGKRSSPAPKGGKKNVEEGGEGRRGGGRGGRGRGGGRGGGDDEGAGSGFEDDPCLQ